MCSLTTERSGPAKSLCLIVGIRTKWSATQVRADRQVTQLTPGVPRSELLPPLNKGQADSRYAYYNSKEGHHAMAAEHGGH